MQIKMSYNGEQSGFLSGTELIHVICKGFTASSKKLILEYVGFNVEKTIKKYILQQVFNSRLIVTKEKRWSTLNCGCELVTLTGFDYVGSTILKSEEVKSRKLEPGTYS